MRTSVFGSSSVRLWSIVVMTTEVSMLAVSQLIGAMFEQSIQWVVVREARACNVQKSRCYLFWSWWSFSAGFTIVDLMLTDYRGLRSCSWVDKLFKKEIIPVVAGRIWPVFVLTIIIWPVGCCCCCCCCWWWFEAGLKPLISWTVW